MTEVTGEETAGWPRASDVTRDPTSVTQPDPDDTEEDRVWNATFDAYHSTGSTIEGAMSRADDAVRRMEGPNSRNPPAVLSLIREM